MSKIEQEDLNAVIDAEEKAIAAKLRALRIDARISCAEFAEALDLELEELISYEDGLEPIPASVIALVCALSGTPYGHFFSKTDPLLGFGAAQIDAATNAFTPEPAVVMD